MRKILERLLEKGFKVTFSEEAGIPSNLHLQKRRTDLHLQARNRPFQRRR